MTAIIDPPWPYRPAGKNHRGCIRYDKRADKEDRYGVLSIDDIKRLPVGDLVGGYVFLWCTGPFIQEGLDCLKAWGFEFKTQAYWTKFNLKTATLQTGTGYWL